MSFWSSDMGQLTGNADDAFTKAFKIIPDGTQAKAKIKSFKLKEHNGSKYYEINWELMDGDYKGQHVFHKIKAFDGDNKKRHKALNMMMLIYKMFNQQPNENTAPQDSDLMVFNEKIAGIKIQEWSMVRDDGSIGEGNYVSEVHPAANFVTETGKRLEVNHQQVSSVPSAFSRNNSPLDEDLPF